MIGRARNGLSSPMLLRPLGPQLVPNGGFDVDLSGWVSGSSGILTRETTSFPNGGLRVENGAAAEGFAYADVTGLSPGLRYEFSFERGAASTSTRVRVGNGSGSGGSDLVNVSAMSDDFFSADIVPSGVAIGITLYCRVGIAGRYFTADNISVRRKRW